MIPRTLSASSLQVLELCPDRWVAEYLHRAGNTTNIAAETGTAVHGALEKFVIAVYVDKTHVGLSKTQLKDLLLDFYKMSYIMTFGTSDMDTLHFTDGRDLVMKWFTRTDMSDRTVLSCEVKETIPVPFNHPDGPTHICDKCDNDTNLSAGQCQVPFNYIMDRLDRVGEDDYEVVDYKTIRVPLQPDDLETKIQARAYALAVQIKYPNAKRIKVTFDMLRHDPISFFFTRDDNIATWRYLCEELQRLVNTPEADVVPTMNPECGYCVKKFTCPLMVSNVAQGGIHSLSIDEQAALQEKLKNMMKAHKIIIEQIDENLMLHAAQSEHLAWDTGDGAFEVEIKGRRERKFDAHQAAEIMGPELFAQMGNMTLGNLEKLIKDDSLDETMRERLKSLIYYQTGNLSVQVKRKKQIF